MLTQQSTMVQWYLSNTSLEPTFVEGPGGSMLLAHGRWFSPETLASSTTKTGRYDITEILLKVALNTKNKKKSINQLLCLE